MPYWVVIRGLIWSLVRHPFTTAVANYAIRRATAGLVRHVRNSTRETHRSGAEHIT